MNKILEKAMPSATDIIRADHTLVTGLFHHYDMRKDASVSKNKALAEKIFTELEIHAAIEEEIFYPAMETEGRDAALVQKSYPEHQEMKELIARLRASEPGAVDYDTTMCELMNNVLHHVANEETQLLPDAEKRLAGQLGELGAKMMKRKLELKTESTMAGAKDFVKQNPFGSVGAVIAAGVAIGLLARSWQDSHRATWR